LKQPKLLFDECISRNAANHIKQFADNFDRGENPPQIGHVLEFQQFPALRELLKITGQTGGRFVNIEWGVV
jgi:hypothetical protein